jgi:hypothetical protein
MHSFIAIWLNQFCWNWERNQNYIDCDWKLRESQARELEETSRDIFLDKNPFKNI